MPKPTPHTNLPPQCIHFLSYFSSFCLRSRATSFLSFFTFACLEGHSIFLCFSMFLRYFNSTNAQDTSLALASSHDMPKLLYFPLQCFQQSQQKRLTITVAGHALLALILTPLSSEVCCTYAQRLYSAFPKARCYWSTQRAEVSPPSVTYQSSN